MHYITLQYNMSDKITDRNKSIECDEKEVAVLLRFAPLSRLTI
jgi:hypothetical protein